MIFDWSKKQFRSIETDKDPLKFLIAISINRKTNSIDRNCKKNEFLKINKIWCNLSLKHWKIMKKNAWVWDEMIFTNPIFKIQFSQKFRFQTISFFFQAIHQLCIKLKVFFKLGWSDLISLRISGLDNPASVRLPTVVEGLQRRQQSKRRPEMTGQTSSDEKVSMEFQMFWRFSCSRDFLPPFCSDRSFI